MDGSRTILTRKETHAFTADMARKRAKENITPTGDTIIASLMDGVVLYAWMMETMLDFPLDDIIFPNEEEKIRIISTMCSLGFGISEYQPAEKVLDDQISFISGPCNTFHITWDDETDCPVDQNVVNDIRSKFKNVITRETAVKIHEIASKKFDHVPLMEHVIRSVMFAAGLGKSSFVLCLFKREIDAISLWIDATQDQKNKRIKKNPKYSDDDSYSVSFKLEKMGYTLKKTSMNDICIFWE